jgi:hypothetical protein
LSGLQGNQGWQGFIGLQGNQGWQGNQGRQGWQGWQGNQGWQGFGNQGNQGWQAIGGSQGNQGWQGTSGSSTFVGCKIYNSAHMYFTNSPLYNVWTADSEDFDTDSMHDNVTNNGRITIPYTGYYEVGFTGYAIDQSTSGTYGVDFLVYKNGIPGTGTNMRGLAVRFPSMPVNTSFLGSASQVLYLTAGDYITLYVNTSETVANKMLIGGGYGYPSQAFYCYKVG